MGVHLKTDGTSTRVTPRGPKKKFTLEELQKFVGGYIELVKTVDGRNMYVNEEGLVHDLPHNALASVAIHPRYITIGGVRGDVIICDRGEG